MRRNLEEIPVWNKPVSSHSYSTCMRISLAVWNFLDCKCMCLLDNIFFMRVFSPYDFYYQSAHDSFILCSSVLGLTTWPVSESVDELSRLLLTTTSKTLASTVFTLHSETFRGSFRSVLCGYARSGRYDRRRTEVDRLGRRHRPHVDRIPQHRDGRQQDPDSGQQRTHPSDSHHEAPVWDQSPEDSHTRYRIQSGDSLYQLSGPWLESVSWWILAAILGSEQLHKTGLLCRVLAFV